MPKRVSMYELWMQSGEDPDRYRELLHEHGAILYPGDEGYEDAPKNLPCGWPHRSEGTGQSAEEAADIINATGA